MVYIVLPIYNEGKRLEILLRKIQKVFASSQGSYIIIAVDDGSIDNSASILSRLSNDLPIQILTHKINRGLGETLRDGFEFATELGADSDFVICMDADDTHDPSLIPVMVEKLNEGFDVVVASRYAIGGKQVGLSLNRRFFSKCANIIVKICFPVRGLKDYSCGYRGYRVSKTREAINTYKNDFIELKGLGFTATPEILIKLLKLNAKITEVPLVLRYDLKESQSKMGHYTTILGYIALILKNIGRTQRKK